MNATMATILVLAALIPGGCDSSGAQPGATSKQLRFATGMAPGSVETSDLNGDGHPDVIVANEQSNNVTILLGNGRGGFQEAKGSPFPAGHDPNDIAVGDFNHDRNMDLAFANHEERRLTVLLGDGRGGFMPAPGAPVAVHVRPHVHGVATGDFNGDGNPDLVTESWGSNQVLISWGDGRGGFHPSDTLLGVGTMPYQRLRVGDVNGDGRADIVTTNLEGDSVTVLLGDGKGTFSQPAGSPFPSGDSPFNFAIGDVNGDGKPDLAIVNSPGSAGRGGKDGLTVLLNDGHGRFRPLPGSPFATGKIPNRVAIGDVNGDGIADVAVSSPDANSVKLFLMSPKGIAASSELSIGGKPKGLALFDLDGDRKADLVVATNADNAVTVFLSR